MAEENHGENGEGGNRYGRTAFSPAVKDSRAYSSRSAPAWWDNELVAASAPANLSRAPPPLLGRGASAGMESGTRPR